MVGERQVGTRTQARRERCPMEATLDVIGGRWKGVILYHLLDGKKRFGELRRLLPAASQRVLTLQLRELEEDGVIHREVFTQMPPKVEYSVTEFGRSLEPALLLLSEWGKQYLSLTPPVPPGGGVQEPQRPAPFVFRGRPSDRQPVA